MMARHRSLLPPWAVQWHIVESFDAATQEFVSFPNLNYAPDKFKLTPSGLRPTAPPLHALGSDLVVAGIPYNGKIPAHPAAACDPRSFSSTSTTPAVHRSRGGMPGNKQEQKFNAY